MPGKGLLALIANLPLDGRHSQDLSEPTKGFGSQSRFLHFSFFGIFLVNLYLNWNQKCFCKAQWREFKLIIYQMTRNSMDKSLIHDHNSPLCVIYKQTFFFLFFTLTLRSFVISTLTLSLACYISGIKKKIRKIKIFSK